MNERLPASSSETGQTAAQAKHDFIHAPWRSDPSYDAEYWQKLEQFCQAVTSSDAKAPTGQTPASPPAEHSQCQRLAVHFYPEQGARLQISRPGSQAISAAASASHAAVEPTPAIQRAFDRSSSPGA